MQGKTIMVLGGGLALATLITTLAMGTRPSADSAAPLSQVRIPDTRPAASAELPAPALPRLSPPEVTPKAPPALPPTLAGTRQEVRLRLTAQGDLLVEPAVLQLFDYYLSAIEDEPIERVLQRIQWDIASQLQGQPRRQAVELLQQYLDYRLALPQLDVPAGMEPEALRQRLQAISALRRQHFGLENSALLFAEDEATDQHLIDRLASQSEPAAEQPASAEGREIELIQQVQALRQRGASEAEVLALRERTLGAEAAQALAELDRQQARWQARLAAFSEQRQRILKSPLAETERQQAIERLLAEQFDERERLRVRALHEEG